MDYAIIKNVTWHYGDKTPKMLYNSGVIRTFRSVTDARRYIINNLDKGGANIVEITSKGMQPYGWIHWHSYPKNGKTAYAWGYTSDKTGGLWFVNKDGTLGRPMPYSTWRVEDGKQKWYIKKRGRKDTDEMHPFGL